MRYSIIAETYERLEETTKRLEMTDILVDLIRQTPPNLIDKLAYLTQGKLYPSIVGVEIGMAEKMAIASISKAAGVEEDVVIRSWKTTGDLGTTAEKLMEEKATPPEPLSVEGVYGTLEGIAGTAGEGSVEAKVGMLADLLRNATPKEARYILRTVTGHLRLGIGDMTFLDALATAYGGDKSARPTVERAYNLSSDLGHVARALAEEGLGGMRGFRITIGRPIRPMLAERMTTAEEVLEKLGGKGSAEYKYDGLRIQAHISSKGVSLFSRRLENLTNQFPDVVKALRGSVKAGEAVIEGECVAVDPNTGELQPFQVITQRRGRKYEIERMTEEVPVTVFLFDALYVDGEALIDSPYPERRRRLEEIVEAGETVRLAEQRVVDEAEELDYFMEGAIERGCEGVLVKSVGEDSVYQAGARGFLWIKYKREYKSEMADTVDLVAVGAFAGRGRRAGLYGALLMAAYDEEEDVFKTVCKLGTGFDDATLARLPDMLGPHRIEHKHPRVESKIEADFWFEPAMVLEMIGSELTLSPSHTCGWGVVRDGSGLAVRFPRFTGRWRDDKGPEDATTVREVVEMYRSQLKRVK